jgi:hypothetical protein
VVYIKLHRWPGGEINKYFVPGRDSRPCPMIKIKRSKGVVITEKPILFSTPMVMAILGGRKTQTRRVVKYQDTLNKGYRPTGFILDTTANKEEIGCFRFDHERFLPVFLKPPYKVEDTLWVRETWCRGFARADLGEKIIYKADIETDLQPIHNWKPAIHMPRKYARIFLEVISVRVERLQQMDVASCVHEGIDPGNAWTVDAKPNFIKLWDSLNAKRGYGWNVNPLVWVIEFKKI